MSTELLYWATRNRKSLRPDIDKIGREGLAEDHSPGFANEGLDHLDCFFPFADCSCLTAFCFLFLSFSFLPPLSPIVDSFLVGNRHSSVSVVGYYRPSALRCRMQPISFCALSNENGAPVTWSAPTTRHPNAFGSTGTRRGVSDTVSAVKQESTVKRPSI